MALFNLYSVTDGANWDWQKPYITNGNPWTFDNPVNPCTDSWQGVTCTIITGEYHVTELVLNNLHLRGTIPNAVCNLTDIRDLSLPDNFLVGTIPDCFGTLTSLTELVLGTNRLEGTIPASFRQLSQLDTLYLESNLLNGTLDIFCDIKSLHILSVYNNQLTGIIPECIGAIPLLTILDINRNRINGTIPSALGNLTQLTQLSLTNLYLTGTIPNSLGNLSSLSYLYLETNSLTGTIPEALGNLRALTEMGIGENGFSGPLPNIFGQLQLLTILTLDTCHLTGSLPSSFFTLRALQSIEMSNNLLTSSIPEAIGNLHALADLSLENNTLTGPFPASLFNMTSLIGIYLTLNELTGPLPSVVSQRPIQLNYFHIISNRLSGTIPSTIEKLASVFGISLSNNYFEGSLPATIGNIHTLAELDLSNNYLTGSVPNTIQNLMQLATLSLQGNRLNGKLNNFVNALQTRITTIQLDDNQFTGELPAVLFQLPSLISLSIVGSCLHGTLPDTICRATQLEALILQGLTTGASCKAMGIPSMSLHGRRQFEGTVPACLLSMPRLHTLLLSSNGFTGKINVNNTVGKILSQLDLSHNLLSGPIPHSIQYHNWSILDLSHNKLNGVLDLPLKLSHLDMMVENNTGLSTQTSLYLDTNRLSGPVPNSVKQLQSNLSVLAGNLFQCRYDKTDLPQHDSDISTYECASNSFDLSIYLWLGLFVVAVAVIGYFFRRYSAVTKEFHTWERSIAEPSSVQNLSDLLNVYYRLYKVAGYCALFCMMVLLPYYIIANHYNSTHTHTYAYVVSALYTTGVVPFVVTTLPLLLQLVGVVVYFFRNWKVATDSTASVIDTWRQVSVIWFVFAATNTTVVLGCNILFVYIVLYQNSDAQTVAQVALSVFKLVWSMEVSPYMMRKLDAYYFPPDGNATSKTRPNYFILQLLVALFNNIAIPCLVVLAIDPNCFGGILLPPGARTVYYLLPVCLRNGVFDPCQDQFFELTSLRFTPPFTYSYQCSASFITAYAPAFVYMSISNVFLHPLLQGVLLYMRCRATEPSVVHKITSWSLPSLLKPPTADGYQKRVQQRRSLVGAVGLLVTLSTQLGILLTFGAIFPPVALAMAVSIAAVVYQTRFKVQRFVQAAMDAQLLGYLEVIDAECVGVGTREHMLLAVKIIVCYCCAFYTLFLFDTLGDAEGFAASVWVLIVVPLAPIVLFGAMQAHTYVAIPAVVCQDDEVVVKANIELTAQNKNSIETISAMHNSTV